MTGRETMNNTERLDQRPVDVRTQRSPEAMNDLRKLEQEKSVLRWGGLAGSLGGILFIVVFVIVGVFVGA